MKKTYADADVCDDCRAKKVCAQCGKLISHPPTTVFGQPGRYF